MWVNVNLISLSKIRDMSLLNIIYIFKCLFTNHKISVRLILFKTSIYNDYWLSYAGALVDITLLCAEIRSFIFIWIVSARPLFIERISDRKKKPKTTKWKQCFVYQSNTLIYHFLLKMWFIFNRKEIPDLLF